MSIVTNYWPDPRFANIGKMQTKNCSVKVLPSNDGITITTTASDDPFAVLTVNVPPNTDLLLALKSGNPDKLALSDNCNANVWTSSDGWLASLTGSFVEFASPSNGLINIRFRAPAQVGKQVTVQNVFLGTNADYEALTRLTGYGFLAGDLMPLA